MIPCTNCTVTVARLQIIGALCENEPPNEVLVWPYAPRAISSEGGFAVVSAKWLQIWALCWRLLHHSKSKLFTAPCLYCDTIWMVCSVCIIKETDLLCVCQCSHNAVNSIITVSLLLVIVYDGPQRDTVKAASVKLRQWYSTCTSLCVCSTVCIWESPRGRSLYHLFCHQILDLYFSAGICIIFTRVGSTVAGAQWWNDYRLNINFRLLSSSFTVFHWPAELKQGLCYSLSFIQTGEEQGVVEVKEFECHSAPNSHRYCGLEKSGHRDT